LPERSPKTGETGSGESSNEDKLDPRIWKIAAVVLLGPFMTVLDSTVVNVSLSSLATDLHTSIGSIQWIVSGYLLSLALMLPLSGWLVDRLGAKRIYLISFTGFTAASVLCGAAHTSGQLVAFRVLQGAAGGLLAPLSQMMLARYAGRHLARVMGFAVMPILIAPILGPVIAGNILQHASWRWLFYLNLPVGVVALALAILLLPNDEDAKRWRTFDLAGFLLLSPGLALLLYGLEYAGQSSGRWSLLAAAPLIAVFLLHAGRRGDRALIDIGLFREPVFSAAAVTQFLSNGGSFAGQMVIPLFLITAYHLPTSQVGWIFTPLGAGMLCSYPLMGVLTERFGCRSVSATGAALALLGTLPLLWMAQSTLSIPLLCAALFVRGVGMGGINIPSISAAYSAVPKENLPVATTAINIVQRLGGPVATTIMAIALEWTGTHAQVFGMRRFTSILLVLAVLHALGLVAALRLPARIPKRPADRVADREQENVQAVEAIAD
jgi:EmrB/QacA subfamily drug resistance transporter